MKKALLALGMMFTMVSMTIAQPSLQQLLKQARTNKGKPNAHLYIQIAKTWLTTAPDSTLKYADAAARLSLVEPILLASKRLEVKRF